MLASWLKAALLGVLVLCGNLLPAAMAGSVPQPVIQQGKGDKCVADEDFMRRNHMKVLNHHRDKTMHEGIRTKQFSLKNCIECHATPNEKGERTVLGKDHFCQSCHSFAAVKIDCFSCHSSKPKGNMAMHPIVPAMKGAGAQSASAMRHHASEAPSLNPAVSAKELVGVIK